MIDIKNAYEQFEKYTKQFESTNGRIKLKIEHILRVAKMSKRIAEYLKLSTEQIQLAELIGLFHDIGRFGQAKIYDTFNDRESVNHAELSAKILFDDNLIDKFNIEKSYYKIIKIAVLNHNKPRIDNNIAKDELLFSQIIRDADKLDICYTICEYDFPSIFWYSDFNCGPINQGIIDNLKKNHFVSYSNIKTNSDQLPNFYAYIFDLYFDFSFEVLKEKKYLDIFTSRVHIYFSNDTVKSQADDLLKFYNHYLYSHNSNIASV